MTPHLTTEQIDRHLAGALSPPELIAFHDHLAECPACREACSARRRPDASARDPLTVPDLRRFQREVSAPADGDPEHLSYEQLIGHVEGTLDAIDREIADSHLELCPMCTHERADLAAYVLTRRQDRRQRRPALRFWRAGAVLAAAAVLILLAVFLPSALRRLGGRGAAPRIALQPTPIVPAPFVPLPPVPHPPVPSIAEARLASALTEKNQAIRQLQAQNAQLRHQVHILTPPTQVATALVGDAASSQLRALRGERGALMGGGEAEHAMRVLMPVGEIVLSDRPSFRWTAAKDQDGTPARYYVVQVWDPRRGQTHPLATSPHVTGTSWTDATPLPRATTLRWQAKAYLDGGEFLAAAPTLNGVANFRVIGLTQAHQITQTRTDLARVYLKNGLIADARRELSGALDADPQNHVALALLNKIRVLTP